jgi:hypothetical protein
MKLFLYFLAVFSIQEIVLFDFLIPKVIKLSIFLFSVFLLVLSSKKDIKFGLIDSFMFISIVLFVFIDIFIFQEIVSTLKDVFHIVKIYILIKLVKVIRFKVNSKLLFILFIIILLSFLYFLFFGKVLYEFNDHSGHHLSLVGLSLSSSIYHIGNLHFARLNFIFDEPGTFAIICSLLAALLINKLINLKYLLIIITVGFTTMSLAFFVWFGIALFGIFIKLFLSKKAFLSIPILLVGFIYFSSSDIFQIYIEPRVNSIFTGNHNRSEGSGLAMQLFLESPLGLSKNYFEERYFSSSGLAVVAAYKGIFYIIPFVFIYLILFIENKILINLWFIVAFFLTLMIRNNFLTGNILIILPIIISIYYTLYNKGKNKK